LIEITSIEEVAVEPRAVGEQWRVDEMPEQLEERLGDERRLLGVLVRERILLVQQRYVLVERAVAQRVGVAALVSRSLRICLATSISADGTCGRSMSPATCSANAIGSR